MQNHKPDIQQIQREITFMYTLEKQIADQNVSADTFQERWSVFPLLFVSKQYYFKYYIRLIVLEA